MSNHLVRLVLLVLAIAAPSAALAQSGQSAIAGVVRDATGGVVPGVTVEASSPALIEKSRTAVATLPTGRSFVTMAGTVPAVLTGQFDVGGSTSMWQGGSLTVHGALNSDSRTLIDGMIADAMFWGG